MKYLFVNNNDFAIKLPGKNGRMVPFSKGQKRVLDKFFKRYSPKHLTVIKQISDDQYGKKVPNVRVIRNDSPASKQKKKKGRNRIHEAARKQPVIHVGAGWKSRRRSIVGRGIAGRAATEYSVARVRENDLAISNDIGVGILSYNRLKSLKHLISSIRKNTNLRRTTVFVSDESTDESVWSWLKEQKDIVVIHNNRAGIAANTNRLLRCLARFRHKLILNDDVEVLRPGWDEFYFKAMQKTGLHHFCYRQEGIYGATHIKPGPNQVITIQNKPHGAVLALDDEAFNKVGYMDENFGVYGMEHVDYSDRIARVGLTPPGYHDFAGSGGYFKIYDDPTSDEHKHENFKKAQEYYCKIRENNNRKYVEPTSKSDIKSKVTYLVPFRNLGREDCIKTVVQNIKAQRFPIIETVIIEQDDKCRINKNKFRAVTYVLDKSPKENQPFCKSSAFNVGYFVSAYDKLILHDADMIVRRDYTDMMFSLLNKHESVHIGETVCYMDQKATKIINEGGSIDDGLVSSNRVVTYYEGGSLGIRKNVYGRIGGFVEDFVGYGCEDCEFYNRMYHCTKSYTKRSIDLFHLWHDRTPGWEQLHEKNRQIQKKLLSRPVKDVASKYADKLADRKRRWHENNGR